MPSAGSALIDRLPCILPCSSSSVDLVTAACSPPPRDRPRPSSSPPEDSTRRAPPPPPARAAPARLTPRSPATTMGVFEPAEGINYNFILGMYLFFLSLGTLFLALEFAFKVDAVQGFYLIFAPFVPASLWHAAPASAPRGRRTATETSFPRPQVRRREATMVSGRRRQGERGVGRRAALRRRDATAARPRERPPARRGGTEPPRAADAEDAGDQATTLKLPSWAQEIRRRPRGGGGGSRWIGRRGDLRGQRAAPPSPHTHATSFEVPRGDVERARG